VLVRTQSRDSIEKIKLSQNVALHFRENAPPHQAKSMTYATPTRANCRRSAKSIDAAHKAFLARIAAGIEQLTTEREAARTSLDDAVPLLTSDPNTTAKVFIAQEPAELEKLEQLMDKELLRRTARARLR
jgi:hypothetical protein